MHMLFGPSLEEEEVIEKVEHVRDAKRKSSVKSCIGCMDDETVFSTPCGTSYCTDCLINMVSSLKETEVPVCSCGCEQRLNVTFDLIALVRERNMEFAKKLAVIGRRNEPNKKCPICTVPILVPFGARVYTCSACVNPAYGFCMKCDRAVEGLDHECVDKESDEAFRAYMAENGIHSCPGCHQAAEKEKEKQCNHMTCICGIKYCAGMVLLKKVFILLRSRRIQVKRATLGLM